MGSSTTVASFRDFEASVSDAWNVSADELLPHSHRNIDNNDDAVTKVHGEPAAAQASPVATVKPPLTRTASEDNANNGSSIKNSSREAIQKYEKISGGYFIYYFSHFLGNF